ncbi:MAG: class F sortase [Candidatus Saccharibacteria bacterium]|nr:class F sortase [Candidatus Saccharibacteria bacterium]
MFKINWKRDKNRIIWGSVILVVALIAARILIWEHNYYESKEGAERATTISSPTEEEEVDEAPISDDQIKEYTVAADRPRYLSIPSIDVVNSRVLPVGLSSSKQLLTPASIYDTGWYTGSGKPGAGGTMLIDGHNGGPTKVGVFKRLPELNKGDIITIERGDGTIFNYQVVENQTLTLAEANQQMNKMLTTPKKGVESLSLITCTGEWSQVQKTYLSRQFLRAILIVNEE